MASVVTVEYKAKYDADLAFAKHTWGYCIPFLAILNSDVSETCKDLHPVIITCRVRPVPTHCNIPVAYNFFNLFNTHTE
jgi:hypothetical protein